MKTNAEKKQMRLRAQVALALTLGMSILPAAALAETITTSRTYEENVTVMDDVDIADGTIIVTGFNDWSRRHEDHTATLKGNVRIINPLNSPRQILESLRRGGATSGDYTGILIINPDRTKTVQLQGKIHVSTSGGSKHGYINLYLRGEDSYFAGDTKENATDSLEAYGGVRLELSEGATWYPEWEEHRLSDSDPNNPANFGRTGGVTNPNKPRGLHLSANGGVIDMAFAAPHTPRAAAVGERTLIFNNTQTALNGATFRISTDLAQNKADNIVLNGATGAGNNYKLQVASNPRVNDALRRANYEIAPTVAGGIEVLRSSNANDTVEASEYTMRKTEVAGLLRSDFTLKPVLSEAVESGSKVVRITKLLVTDEEAEGPALQAADVLMDMAVAQMSAWRGENNDLHRRMGALRAGGESGAWVRGYGGRNEFGRHSTTGRYSGVQVGIDRAAPLKDGTLFTGVAASMMNGSARNSDLDGSYRSHFFGAYGSYMGKRGDYLDAIVKYGRMTNNATAVFDGSAFTGGYGVNGWNISVEYGRRMPLRGHFYWTPQAELNYGRIGGTSYTMRAAGLPGARVDNDAVTTLIGRIGTQIGYEDAMGSVYLKLGFLHEFKGDLHMRATYGSTAIDRSYSARDSYFEYGLGFARRVGRADLYGEVSRTAGADAIKENWKANLGVRVGF